MQAMLAVLSDTMPQSVEALFVHGSPVRDNRLDQNIIRNAVTLYDRGTVNTIVLNGLTRQMCEERNTAYYGFESWQKMLLEQGVLKGDIVLLPPSNHTGMESRNLLTLAKERGWRTLGISSQAYHQLRCFLQIVALMPETDWYPAVYNMPAPGIPWGYPMVKPVIKDASVFAEDVTGSLAQHIEAEFQRVMAYAQQPTLERPFTRHASIPEMLTYLTKRE